MSAEEAACAFFIDHLENLSIIYSVLLMCLKLLHIHPIEAILLEIVAIIL